ncbi:hypothetical protein [Nannocystis sp. SCPEA4]|uniref:hypothetical protein n=1 Tax=Nannocystis sp. SCPEA4 TaxID=2996787 RepID=UPI00226EC2B3|nr:hypothetical protein [Nannocystis sp. SCPEA4]MCY1060179.1 hypothetical protein [Nannocystis sp. SCPEA4]
MKGTQGRSPDSVSSGGAPVVVEPSLEPDDSVDPEPSLEPADSVVPEPSLEPADSVVPEPVEPGSSPVEADPSSGAALQRHSPKEPSPWQACCPTHPSAPSQAMLCPFEHTSPPW